jgi:hypothetical protein
MVSIAAKLAELVIATIPALVVKLVLRGLRFLGQKAMRAILELVGLGIYYTGGWLLWVIWVVAVYLGWTVLPMIQKALPAAADIWATGLLVVMAIGLALWTTRQRRIAMRQRRMQRQLLQAVGGVSNRLDNFRGELLQGAARRTRGTPFGGVFRSNRDAERQAEADAQAAYEQAERHRREAARQAEAERLAKEEHDRWAEQAQFDHDPFQRQGS